MGSLSFKRLLREWVALLAILAMVLGPLSLAVSRGLSAQERVNVAAGLSSLKVCSPSASEDGLVAQSNIDCDHCLPASGSAKITANFPAPDTIFFADLIPAGEEASLLLLQRQLPPATGPPS
jgi:hypothetical protein